MSIKFKPLELSTYQINDFGRIIVRQVEKGLSSLVLLSNIGEMYPERIIVADSDSNRFVARIQSIDNHYGKKDHFAVCDLTANGIVIESTFSPAELFCALDALCKS